MDPVWHCHMIWALQLAFQSELRPHTPHAKLNGFRFRFCAEFGEHENHLNILVNNAGTTWGQPFAKMPAKAFDRVFSLNVTSMFAMTQALTPLLDKGSSSDDPARIINIGSVAGMSHSILQY